jgi:hypothetical protein
MINQVTLEKLKPHWADSQIPFLTWQWHDTWQKVFGKLYQPYYLLINNSVIAPFIRNGQTILWSGGDEIADYLDLIGPDNQKGPVWIEIMEFFKKEGITTVALRNIPENSPTVSFFKTQPNAKVIQEDTTPLITLPTEWNSYLESLEHKNRHELERKTRKFEREQKDIKIYNSADPVGDTDLFLSLMKLDGRKKEFLTPDMELFFRNMTETFKENLILTILTVSDTPAAAMLAFHYRETLMGYNSGFDEQHFSGAGFYLKSMHIKRAIENKIKIYNFLQGNERYKYNLGGKDFFVYSIQYQL